ncbi:MAG: hypothetical protein AAB697_03520 [Patescibacteria group bacterium]
MKAIEVVRMVPGKEIEADTKRWWFTRDGKGGSEYHEETGKVRIVPQIPVYRDPVTGKEKLGSILT